MGAYRLRCPNCHFSNFFDRARTDDDGLRHRGTHASEFATRRYFNVRAFAKGHYLYTAVCRKLLPALRLDDEVDNAFAIPTAPANAFDLAFLINTQVASL